MKKPSAAKKSKSEAAKALDAEKIRVSTANVTHFCENADIVATPAVFLPTGGLKAAKTFLTSLFHMEHRVVYSADLFNLRTTTVAGFGPSWIGSRRGCYVKVNRLTADAPTGANGGVRDADCGLEYVMVELDKCPVGDQHRLWSYLIGLGLPVVSLTDSAGKSLHAIFRINAGSVSAYKQTALALADLLLPFLPDNTSLNPSRFTRLPGFRRGEQMQSLLWLNPNAETWTPDHHVNHTVKMLCEGCEPVPSAVADSMARATTRHTERDNDPAKDKDFKDWVGTLGINGVLHMPNLIDSLGWASCEAGETGSETKFFIQCPWSSDHGGGGDADGAKDAYIFERKTSARWKWGFHCSHDACRCAGRTIKDVFDLLVDSHREALDGCVAPWPDLDNILEDEPEPVDPPAPESAPADPSEPAPKLAGTGELMAMMPSEYADSEIFLKMHGKRIKYLHDEAKWMVWKKGVWVRDSFENIRELAKDVGRHRLLRAKTEDEKELASRSTNSKLIDGVLKTVRSTKGVAVVSADFDRNPYLVGCQNGVLDIRTRTLSAGDPKDMVSLRLGVNYVANATCDRWREFMLEIQRTQPEVAAFLKRLIGYALYGRNPEQKLVILHGHGANGKSTFLDNVQAVMGDYGINAHKGLLIASPRGDDPGAANPAVADLKGKRLACVSETEAESALSESKVKDLLSGEEIRARQLYSSFQTFRPEAKLILSSNHLPKISGTDRGLWRRILVADFLENFLGREDPSLPLILESEREGMLIWGLEGFDDWQEQGLNPPPCVLLTTAGLQKHSDVLGMFLSSCCEVGDDQRCLFKDLYSSFRQWASENGLGMWSAVTFARRMRDRGMSEREIKGYKTWAGVSLRESALD